jgi:hypothetical protein
MVAQRAHLLFYQGRDGHGEYVHGTTPQLQRTEAGALGSTSTKLGRCRCCHFMFRILLRVSVLSLGVGGCRAVRAMSR